jgi:hypothetical protein
MISKREYGLTFGFGEIRETYAPTPWDDKHPSRHKSAKAGHHRKMLKMFEI